MILNGIMSKSGLTCNCTESEFLEFLSKGCPICGSKEFDEGTHPEYGGLFIQCIKRCNDTRGVRFYAAWQPWTKRLKGYEQTHSFRIGGYQK